MDFIVPESNLQNEIKEIQTMDTHNSGKGIHK
jgi:hypothetical protein